MKAPVRWLALAAATGCTMVQLGSSELYAWLDDPSAPYCEKATWKQVSLDRIPGLCDSVRNDTSCQVGCLVVSPYSEAHAKRIRVRGGESLYEHELRHVLEGLVHPPGVWDDGGWTRSHRRPR